MVGTRSAQIPFEYVVAELAAAPLALHSTLGLALTELSPQMAGKTGQLWRATENALLADFSAYSVDEITALRDWLWFNQDAHPWEDENKPVPLGEFLSRFARDTLIFVGESFRPRRPRWSEAWMVESGLTDDPLARRYWRWVAFSLPPDLMVAAHPDSDDAVPFVEVVSPVVNQILLDEGFVEPHMHLGAALDFQLLWIGTLHVLARSDVLHHDAFASPGAVLDEGREMGSWLVMAALIRYVLAGFIHQHDKHQNCGDFQDYRENHVRNMLGESGLEFTLNHCFACLEQGQLLVESRTASTLEERKTLFNTMQRAYEGIARVQYRWPEFPVHLPQALQADPISCFFPTNNLHQRSSEIQFVSAALKYLKSPSGSRDFRFAKLFWQVTRIRCLFYRHVIQRPLTPGLQWFMRFYSRLYWPTFLIGRGLLTESAAILCGKDRGLKSLEVRLSPKGSYQLQEKVLRQVISAFDFVANGSVARPDGGRVGDGLGESNEEVKLQAADNDTNVNDSCEYGIVLHFTKDIDSNARMGLPNAHRKQSNADPSLKENLGYRYGAYYRSKHREMQVIAGLLTKFPRLLFYIRGIDVCADELGIPTWVLAPIIRHLKVVSRNISSFLKSQEQARVPAFRTTAHAGEDFLHLLGGLRRIDETVEQFQMSQGDRLGHAIALGINPREWATQTRGVALSRMERLKDLAWEWSFTTQNSVKQSASRLQFILDEIERLSRQIFGIFARPTQVVEFISLLHNGEELRQLNFPKGSIPELNQYVNTRFKETYSRQGRIPLHPGLYGATQRDSSNGRASDGKSNEFGELGATGLEPWILLYRYLIEPETFKQGQIQILIDPSREADTLDALQRELRRKIGNLGIAVEINPSSNLLIGNMADLKNHPLWRLNPPRPDSDLPPVSVCIGSDDPISFATSTREEYQLVYDTLTLAGISDFEARTWLDSARKVGLSSRFTFKHSRSVSYIWQAIAVPDEKMPIPPPG